MKKKDKEQVKTIQHGWKITKSEQLIKKEINRLKIQNNGSCTSYDSCNND